MTLLTQGRHDSASLNAKQKDEYALTGRDTGSNDYMKRECALKSALKDFTKAEFVVII